MKAAVRMKEEAYDFMERGDIEDMAAAVHAGGVMSATERQRVERVLRIWEFGKAALLEDDAGQHIRRQLQYQPRIKETPTFWQSLIQMNDDDAYEFDRLLCATCTEQERKVLLCQYQYHQSEDAGARVLHLGRYHFRAIRDRALNKLLDKKS